MHHNSPAAGQQPPRFDLIDAAPFHTRDDKELRVYASADGLTIFCELRGAPEEHAIIEVDALAAIWLAEQLRGVAFGITAGQMATENAGRTR